ncbi:putative zinc-binding metallopeptidase [Alistipes sp.]|uniref:putative zinc-binding metallopeptidase n=1 Tax=Alistipes sp. TaxID=1872444 RepID=UPI003AF003EA
MKTIKLFLLLAAGLLTAACGEDNIGENYEILGLGGDREMQTELDRWIYENITVPYNMEVKYRWDRSEVDLTYTLVPVKEEVVRPIMQGVVKGWIKPYEEVTRGTDNASFIYKLSPKKFMLVGSAKYSGSTIVTGEAEGGRKVVIFRANDYKTDPEVLISMLKTCHHEFAHTISQAQRYPEEFAEVTSESYTTKWTSVSTVQARHNGFVSNYACKSPGEDFAETLAFLCMYGREWYEELIAQESAWYAKPENRKTSYDPGAALRTKQSLIETYLKSTWGVELYDTHAKKGLITLVQEAIREIRDDIEAEKNLN